MIYFIVYTLCACLLILARPKMIWQEKNKPYRVTLLVLSLPVLLTLNFGSHLIAWIRTMWYICCTIVEGREPIE